MKFLKQFMVILLLSFLGEVLKMFVPLPIPVWTCVDACMFDDWRFKNKSGQGCSFFSD